MSARNWAFCAKEAQDAIDAVVTDLCNAMDVRPINAAAEAIVHIMTEVVKPSSFRDMEKPTPEALGTLLYCLIRDGRIPDSEHFTKMYRVAMHHLGNRAERAAMARQIRELRLG